MIIKKIAITAAAGALMLASAAGAFADINTSGGSTTNLTSDSYNNITKTYTKNVTVKKADITNSADISNDVYTISNSGLNFTSTNGGDTTSNTSAKTGNVSGDTTTGDAIGAGSTTGGATGGNTGGDATAASLTGGGSTSSSVTTGNAGASSWVANVVNTTMLQF